MTYRRINYRPPRQPWEIQTRIRILRTPPKTTLFRPTQSSSLFRLVCISLLFSLTFFSTLIISICIIRRNHSFVEQQPNPRFCLGSCSARRLSVCASQSRKTYTIVCSLYPRKKRRRRRAEGRGLQRLKKDPTRPHRERGGSKKKSRRHRQFL